MLQLLLSMRQSEVLPWEIDAPESWEWETRHPVVGSSQMHCTSRNRTNCSWIINAHLLAWIYSTSPCDHTLFMSVPMSLACTFHGCFMSYARPHINVIKAYWLLCIGWGAGSALHGRVLMKVVRWRQSCQTQKHFTRLHLSWFCQSTQCTASKREIRARSHFTAQCPAVYTALRGCSTGMPLCVWTKILSSKVSSSEHLL